ncbi:putative DNA-binding transcriptional regulator YafY [Catalinimonas alkaloidigena]|uniref:phytanoyl-CoA dioxygenase family protein n=1 Tax=Catalinimonas alkaloidigena TaxID=1075417 RepID=UPI0024062EC0|nr:WYL domain-containing protein [Catalinimonas alkaloidigena]MDF9794982.1 putative DNA-binding transcriptional regulator YafY [Catalinimonas alkaloidigena]
MPVNRNALIRYKTIDQCLRNRFRKWTLEDLVEACSEALYEYEGIEKGVSTRTVQLDLQMMRSEKLGYNAPIVVTDRKYYTYEDPYYSITNIPLTDKDLNKLTEVIEILKQFKGFSHFHDLSGMVQKLEDRVYTEKTKQESVIQFETNENVKGLEFIDDLYQAIIQKKAIHLTYQSFKARNPQSFDFHAQLLKEFRNRWFVLGFKGKRQLPLLLALDRVIDIAPCNAPYIPNTQHDLQTYFKDVVGVSVEINGSTEHVEIFVEQKHLPYILTKPIHHSQQLKQKLPGGGIITLDVQLNFELEKELLGYGETIKILNPPRLFRSLKKRVAMAHQLYTYDLHPIVAKETIKKVDRRGTAVLDGIYTTKEVEQMCRILDSYKASVDGQNSTEVFAIRKLLQELPVLKEHIFNLKLHTLIKEGMGEDYFLCKAIYFDKPSTSNWYVSWHQDVPINVQEKIETEGYSGWTSKKGVISVRPPVDILKNMYTIRIHLDKTTAENGALHVYPKSHFGIWDHQQIEQFRQTKTPTYCEVEAGGIHLMKPLTLHASQKTTNAQSRRVIHLEFASSELSNGFEWGEKEAVMFTR